MDALASGKIIDDVSNVIIQTKVTPENTNKIIGHISGLDRSGERWIECTVPVDTGQLCSTRPTYKSFYRGVRRRDVYP